MLEARHPLAKLACALIAIAVITVSEALPVLLAAGAATLVLLATVRQLSPHRLLRLINPFVLFAALSSWIYLVAENPAHAALGLPGWHSAIIVVIRILAIGLIAIAFAETTQPADLARALVLQAHLPRRFVYGALAAVQFMPALVEDYRMARLTALSSLPAAAPGRGLWQRWRRLVAGMSPDVLVAIMAGALRRAGNAAVSMQMRGLADKPLTNTWRRKDITAADRALVGLTVLFFCTAYVLAWVFA